MAWWLKNMTEGIVESLTGNLISQDCTTQDCSRGNRSIQHLESLKAGRPGFALSIFLPFPKELADWPPDGMRPVGSVDKIDWIDRGRD